MIRLILSGDTRLSEFWQGLFCILCAVWIVAFQLGSASGAMVYMVQIAPAIVWALLYAITGALRWWGLLGGLLLLRLMASYAGVFLVALTLWFTVAGAYRALIVPTWAVFLLSSIVIHIQLSVQSREAMGAAT